MSSAPATDPPPLRLPSSPYPGLRPFLDHEEMLMYGRQAQVEDVVQRLGRPVHADPHDAAAGAAPLATRFVAVLGGSGSGKSSLIRAGVVPYLRQFGIPAAGDLWETVVATPGTNFQPDADGMVRESPITRLARKFERVLRGEHRPERCEAIEQTLRRPGGLGQMVELFGPELNLPEGVPAEKACLLLVIDQFEELFHKTNVDQPDARQLIERVIDHYHQARNGLGCDRCYLAITMRSEHLNDCAGYLGLPEAINAGSYLVSRLDAPQVREVIEKPAQRYLRLRQRERQALARQDPPVDLSMLPPLPRAVAFEPTLVDRLVQDTGKLANNPDHLPLLQHVLSRMWDSALDRLNLKASDVPDAITLPDLWRAAQAGDDTPLPPEQNVLTLSLDSWAEKLLASHPPEQRKPLLDLFRRLVYKDPRTGTYNQQRLYVASHPLGTAGVRALVEGRWIESVDYLYWDAEDPERVTLKVSHESFIRGWKTLRELADNEAVRLENFMALLEATRTWVDKGRRDSDVMDERMLGRMRDMTIEEAIGPRDAAHDKDPETFTWHEWHGWLGQLPQGQALTEVPRADVRRFFRRSNEVLERRIARGRNNARAISALSAVVLVFLLGTAFSLLVQQPVIDRAELYFQAADKANKASLRNAYDQIGGSQIELEALVDAAGKLELARSPEGKRYTVSNAVLHGSWSPLKGLRLANLLPDAARAIEPPVNGKLRALLTRSVWRTGSASTSVAEMIDDSSSPPRPDVTCNELSGILKPVEGSRSQDPVKRGVFVSTGRLVNSRTSADSRNNLMYAAQVSEADGSCVLGQQLLALPSEREPAVMFDALLGYMLLASDRGPQATVSVHRVVWDDPDSGLSAEIHQPLAVVFGTDTAEALRRQVPGKVGMAERTWRTPAGRAMRVADEDWRLVADSAQRLVPQPTPEALRPLREDRSDRHCEALRVPIEQELKQAGTAAPDGKLEQTRISIFRDGDYCLAILRTPLLNRSASASQPPDPQKARHLINLRAHIRPSDRDLDASGRLQTPQVVVASVEFGRVRPDDDQWLTGRPGQAFAGWLIVRPMATPRQPEPRLRGIPWSTPALLQLGRELLQDHRAEEAQWRQRRTTRASGEAVIPAAVQPPQSATAVSTGG